MSQKYKILVSIIEIFSHTSRKWHFHCHFLYSCRENMKVGSIWCSSLNGLLKCDVFGFFKEDSGKELYWFSLNSLRGCKLCMFYLTLWSPDNQHQINLVKIKTAGHIGQVCNSPGIVHPLISLSPLSYYKEIVSWKQWWDPDTSTDVNALSCNVNLAQDFLFLYNPFLPPLIEGLPLGKSYKRKVYNSPLTWTIVSNMNQR